MTFNWDGVGGHMTLNWAGECYMTLNWARGMLHDLELGGHYMTLNWGGGGGHYCNLSLV